MSTSKAKVKTQELQVLNSFSIPDILAKLNEELKKMETIETTKWKTSGQLSGFKNNIQNETLLDNLYRMYAVVFNKKKGYDEATADLLGQGVPCPIFRQDGYTLDEWKHDILLRKDIIEQKEKLEKLRGFKEQAQKYLSVDDQKKILLKDMMDFFGISKADEIVNG